MNYHTGMNRNYAGMQIGDLAIEAGIERLAGRVADGDHSYFPRICLLVDQASGMVLRCEISGPAGDDVALLCETINSLVDSFNAWPRQIHLKDPQLAARLREVMLASGARFEVVVRESLPMLEQALSFVGNAGIPRTKKTPALMDVPGMTLDHVLAFAEAAREFYDSEPWQYLVDRDLIEIESPHGPPGTQFAQVLGAGGETFGMGFAASRKIHEDLIASRDAPRGGLWCILFGDLDALEYEDGELWRLHRLPVANQEAYASFQKISKTTAKQPTPQQLTWAEGLLRALAQTSEVELDPGHWEKEIETFSGTQTYRFSMPVLLEANAGASTLPSDIPPVEAARELCARACESFGRVQLNLARQALQVDPDCLDALILLAQREVEAERALPLMRRAVEAGERSLKEHFEKGVGNFWLIPATRPYMEARRKLALLLTSLEEFHQAADHLRDLIRLNPNDNQGNRYLFAQCLLHANRLDELDELLNHSIYKDDFSAEWAFTRALLEYRQGKDRQEVRRRLEAAQQLNPFVAPMLRGELDPPTRLPEIYSPGSEEEAVICVTQIADGWQQSPGALKLLECLVDTREKLARKWQRERQKKHKRR
jgi:tetratricopeptide (TPR) repeat protein